MKIAFLFPGQGRQSIGMGKDLYEKYEKVRNIYKKVSEITKIDIAKLSFEGPEKDLNNTQNTQIAIATMSLSILELLKNKNIKAEIVTGLSLGEYPALIYSGFIKFEDGINLLKQRGYYMANYIPSESYAMIAVIGLDSKKIEEACKNLRKQGKFVVPANYNYSEQIVISGNLEPVEEISEILKQEGAKKIIKLNTSSPFHTKKLEKAKELYKKELEKVNFLNGTIKVIKNIDGTFYKPEDNLVKILAKHIVSPVRFDKAIKLMLEQGIDTFIEIGPGKTLTGFIKRENQDVNTFNINSVESFEEVVAKIGK